MCGYLSYQLLLLGGERVGEHSRGRIFTLFHEFLDVGGTRTVSSEMVFLLTGQAGEFYFLLSFLLLPRWGFLRCGLLLLTGRFFSLLVSVFTSTGFRGLHQIDISRRSRVAVSSCRCLGCGFIGQGQLTELYSNLRDRSS